MPRFFIHHVEANLRIEDEEGAVFADLAEARREAKCAALEMMADHLRGGSEVGERVLEIWDESGQHLGSVLMRDLSPL